MFVRALIVVGLLVWPLAHQTIDLGAALSPSARDGALRLIKSVRAAQGTYRSVHGYYDRLECLVQDACVPNPYPPTYLAAGAMRASAYGYRFRLAEGPRARRATTEFVSPTAISAYAFTAIPAGTEVPDSLPSFCADEEGVYEYADGRTPVVADGRCLDRTNPTS